MNEPIGKPVSENEVPEPDEKNPRDRQGFEEVPATQGLKTPPVIEPGEDSGEWTRGGGADPNAIRRTP